MTPKQHQDRFWAAHPAVALTCGVLLGFVDGRHCRCVLPPDHDELAHVDRTNRWWT